MKLLFGWHRLFSKVRKKDYLEQIDVQKEHVLLTTVVKKAVTRGRHVPGGGVELVGPTTGHVSSVL